MNNLRIATLKAALTAMEKADLDEMTIEDLDRLESDLGAWSGLAMVAAIGKRAAIRDEEIE